MKLVVRPRLMSHGLINIVGIMSIASSYIGKSAFSIVRNVAESKAHIFEIQAYVNTATLDRGESLRN